jgi:hypothetical protein
MQIDYTKNGTAYEMELFFDEAGKPAEIEWREANATNVSGMVEHIGLVFEGRNLVDYDGIPFYLPAEAAKLIRKAGYTVSADFLLHD